MVDLAFLVTKGINMSLIFKWSITKLQVIPQHDDKQNVVVAVDWLVNANDEVNLLTASAAGTKQFVLGAFFIPYDQLTEQQVLNWCFAPETIVWTDLDGVEHSSINYLKDEWEAQVTGQIERQLAKKQSEPALPWAS